MTTTNDSGWSSSRDPKLATSRGAANPQRGVFAILRALVPPRLLDTRELELVAELQANRLLELADVQSYPVPSELIAELPRILVHMDPELRASGATRWVSGRWLIIINAREPWQRQRYTMAHELSHVLMHPYFDVAFAGPEAAEFFADVFAACLLMPKRAVKRAWGEGMQSTATLATYFGVSQPAIGIRLHVLGLRQLHPRHIHERRQQHGPPDSGRYFRSAQHEAIGATV